MDEGDYVMATKYHDGDPEDHWCIGFFDSMTEHDPPRYNVVDENGVLFRGNGFRRIKRIGLERGVWMIANKDQIKSGARSVWWWARRRIEETSPKDAIAERREGEAMILTVSIEVKDADILGVLNWHEAVAACLALGEGWRLPTKDELDRMFVHLKKAGKGDLSSAWYWSSSEQSEHNAWKQKFSTGQQNFNHKYSEGVARAVRDVKDAT